MSAWSCSLIRFAVCLHLLFFCSARAADRKELLVRFKPSAAAADRARALKNSENVQPLQPSLNRQSALHTPSPGTTLVTLRAGVSAASEIARLERNPAVAFVEPNYPLRLFSEIDSVTPDDFEFGNQYALANPGNNGAKTNADISASKAWKLTTGRKGILVAVIDTGIDYFHEDLHDNLWRNEREIPSNGIDDDGNGYIDDFFGYDFVSKDSDPFDDNEHGTHVAGIIAAKGNNGIGTAGVCWDASLMALKAFDHEGNGTVADAIAAIHYAVANGARIINASWGLGEKSRALEEAAGFAADAGVLLIAAAGNDRTDSPAYPASFGTVLSVAASDNRDKRALFSNYGPTVDVAAPGVDILSTLPENRYGPASGTSMAAPHVSGTAALVLARFPEYSRQELFDILVNSVDPVLFDFPIGGRLNALLAVRMDQPLPIVRLDLPPTLSGRRTLSGTAIGSYFAGYLLRAGAGTYPTNWVTLATSARPVTNSIVGHFDSSLIPDGTATVQLIVSNRNGLTATASASVRLLNGLITSPLSGDILRPGKFPVRGTVFGSGKSYELFYGAGYEPESWIPLASGTADESTNVLLGEWDASELPAGFYALRLVVGTGEPQKHEFIAPVIYIDRELKEGWPAHLPITMDFPPSDWRNIRVADIDGNGRSEMLLVDPSYRSHPQTLFVYGADGHLIWSRHLGFDIPPDMPVAGDVDADGAMEIFVDSTNGIAAFNLHGAIVPGWPVETTRRNHAKVLADLDQDGDLELIAYSQEFFATQVAETRELAVYNADGSLVQKWEIPWCGFTNAVQKISPAVANIDDDPDLEIVVVSGCQEITAYNAGRLEPKWRAFTQSPVLASPVIGDVDGRNGPDIVVAAAAENDHVEGGIYIFNGRGERWLGWPVLEEYSFTAAPALGDLDSDGRLEIVITSMKPAALHVVQWDGFEADGWPKVLTKVSWHNNVGVADVLGDSAPEVILTAPGYVNLVVAFSNIEYAGGISAYNFAGEEQSWSGTPEFKARLLEGATARWHRAGPAVVCDLDSDGKLDLVSATLLDRAYGTYTQLKNRSSIYAWEFDVPYRASSAAWPMFGHDPQNTGAYSLPMVPIPPPTNATVAIRDRMITVEDHAVELEPLINDWNASGQPLSLSGFTQPTNGAVTAAAGGKLAYVPATNFAGFDEFTYVIGDATGRTSTGRVVLRVKPVNDIPKAQDMAFEMVKNTSQSIFFKADDAENDPLTFTVGTSPANGEVWNYPTVGQYVPRKGFHGVDSFTYYASDGKSSGEPATITVTVINSNNPPKALEIESLTKTNRAVRIDPAGTDPDGDPLTFEIVQKPVNGTAAAEGNSFHYTPDQDYVGDDSFTFRAYDGTAFGEPAIVKIGIIATNATPRALNGDVTVQPNSTNLLLMVGVDPDGDKIQYTLLAPPLHGEVLDDPPRVRYVPRPDYLGPDRFTFKVTDSFAESEPATFNITVSRENRPPQGTNQVITIPQDSRLEFELNSFDPDGDPVRTVILRGPANGIVFGSARNFTYVPRPTYFGEDRFTYKMWDGHKFGNEGVVTIKVRGLHQTDPVRFESVRRNEAAVELIVSSGSAGQFSIQTSTNLLDWENLAGPIEAGGDQQRVLDTNAPGLQRFYRAVVE